MKSRAKYRTFTSFPVILVANLEKTNIGMIAGDLTSSCKYSMYIHEESHYVIIQLLFFIL